VSCQKLGQKVLSKRKQKNQHEKSLDVSRSGREVSHKSFCSYPPRPLQTFRPWSACTLVPKHYIRIYFGGEKKNGNNTISLGESLYKYWCTFSFRLEQNGWLIFCFLKADTFLLHVVSRLRHTRVYTKTQKKLIITTHDISEWNRKTDIPQV